VAADGANLSIGAPAANSAFAKKLSDFALPAASAGGAQSGNNGGFGAAVAVGSDGSYVVGAPGGNAIHLFNGSATPTTASALMSAFGASVALLPLGGQGSVVVAGAPATLSMSPGPGAVYAFRPGSPLYTAASPTMQLDANGTPAALSITGAHPGDGFGAALAVTDVDGDGFADLVIAGKQSIYVYKGPLP
jgi:hypothetical protein